MLFKFEILALVIVPVLGRELWLERDNRPVHLYPRSAGHQNPALLTELSQTCPDQICRVLSREAVQPLLAASPECTQQDMADKIIDAAQQFDSATKAKMIDIAIKYRQLQKNTQPDFTFNPPKGRNSVFCQKAPKHKELVGLVQEQDKDNDPDLFADPVTGKTIKNGERADTFPFGTSSKLKLKLGSAKNLTKDSTTKDSTKNSKSKSKSKSSSCPAKKSTKKSTKKNPTKNPAKKSTKKSTKNPTKNSKSKSKSSSASCPAKKSTKNPTKKNPTKNPAKNSTQSKADGKDIGNFGSCTVPQIDFGTGFDNRRESAYRPTDPKSYPHGSAQNIGVITQFICDSLTNTCKADDKAKATCAKAQDAANAQPPKTGKQADAFNAVFGITTNLADKPVVDDTGRVVSGGKSTSNPTGGIGNVGKCSIPQIDFGPNFDGRKETAYKPHDPTSFNHGSAQNIGIIAQFICDRLKDTCGADGTALDTCTKATQAAQAEAPKTGKQADAFNAVWGIKTDFANVPVLDDHGNVVG